MSRRWTGAARVIGPKWLRIPTLTITMLGVSIIWSAQMANVSPYMISLGMKKSSIALVFLADPIAGLFVQPLVGLFADNSKSRFGRRRPFIIAGCAMCVFGMLLLGYTRSIASVFTSRGSSANDSLTIVFAVLAFYMIDFSVNAVEAMDRALIVDILPVSEQTHGNAWAAIMGGVGTVVGFFISNLNLPGLVPGFGTSQLGDLSASASILMLLTHAVTVLSVQERVSLCSGDSENEDFVSEFKTMVREMFRLPHVIQQICLIQFFAWIAWFPLIFYTTTYIGSLYKQSLPDPTSPDQAALLDADATRLGSRVLFYSAILSMCVSIGMPFVVRGASGSSSDRASSRGPRWKMHLASLWAVSQLVFALCLLCTWFVSGTGGARFLVVITGFCGAVSAWAPYSLLSEAILTEADATEPGSIQLIDTVRREESEHERFLSRDDLTEAGETKSDDVGWEDEDRTGGGLAIAKVKLASKAGVYLGIHNVYTVLPQVVATAMSALVFALREPEEKVTGGSGEGKSANSIGVIFRLGGLSALVAFVLSWRLAGELKRRDTLRG